jgi:Transposase DDE domain
MNQNEQVSSKTKDSWLQLLSFLPNQWQEKCKELGAIQRKLRKFSGPEAILHTLLIHLLGGYSLRETKAVAKVGNIADVSDVAVLKRLKRAGNWLRWMAQQMITEKDTFMAPSLQRLGMNISLIDATVISEPGSKGINWRIHYSFDLPLMRCAQVKVTDYKTGETFKNFDIEQKTLYIGDRGLYHPQGIEHVLNGGANVLVRMTVSGPALYHPDGKPFGLLTHLRSLKGESVGDWPVFFKTKHKIINGRVCAIRKNKMAAHNARQEVLNEHRKRQKNPSKAALEACKYVFVFTTLSVAQLPAAASLELYRGRWQIELVFKRMKSILGIGQLHKHDPQGIVAWLYGKLLCAILIEKLLETAEVFPPQDKPSFTQAA